jgi:hypothetical protein
LLKRFAKGSTGKLKDTPAGKK